MSPARHTRRHVLPPRARRLVRIVGIGAVLALVILGVGIAMNLLSPNDAARNPVPVVVQPGQSDYEAGVAALASGETTAAIELLQKAAAAGNPAAKAKLADISDEETTTPGVVPTDTFTAAVKDIASLLPSNVAGYVMADVETSTVSGIVSAEPSASGPKEVSRMVFTVSDRKTASRAQQWLSDFGRAYPKALETVRVADVSARFGTDGAHLASVSFVRGRFGFEVVATAVRGDPKQLKAIVLQAAAAFDAAHTLD